MAGASTPTPMVAWPSWPGTTPATGSSSLTTALSRRARCALVGPPASHPRSQRRSFRHAPGTRPKAPHPAPAWSRETPRSPSVVSRETPARWLAGASKGPLLRHPLRRGNFAGVSPTFRATTSLRSRAPTNGSTWRISSISSPRISAARSPPANSSGSAHPSRPLHSRPSPAAERSTQTPHQAWPMP